MHNIELMTSNYLINVSFIAWFSAQVIKTLLTVIFTKKVVFERLIGSGGMPSSHAATVCALAVGMAKKTGFDSPEFALAIVLAAVVMYDAMGVRRAAGEQAKVINVVVKHLSEKAGVNSTEDLGQITENEKTIFNIEKQVKKLEYVSKLKELVGHTPMEVLAGAILGILVAVYFPFS